MQSVVRASIDKCVMIVFPMAAAMASNFSLDDVVPSCVSFALQAKSNIGHERVAFHSNTLCDMIVSVRYFPLACSMKNGPLMFHLRRGKKPLPSTE